MKRICLLLTLLGALSAASSPNSWGAGPLHKNNLPPCEPGYQWVEVTEYQEVCRDVCRLVPDVKKTTKWVYSQVEDPFCIKKSPHGHGHHGKQCAEGCAFCQGPHHRHQLVKRQVVCEEPTTKCVVEKIVEQVPCKVWRKVPCGTQTVGPEVAAPGPMPMPAPLVTPPVIK